MYDDKLATYFIAVPTDNGFGHMTIKFLGKLTDMEVYKWIGELNKLKGMEKFPVKSLGVGVLGRYNSHIVDYVQENKRLLRTLGVFGNTPSTQPPHVTRMKINAPMNTGPLDSMDTVLADKVVLYKVVGPKKYQVVHEVQLSKRNPLTWVMDGLGLSKYAENGAIMTNFGFHKFASSRRKKKKDMVSFLPLGAAYPVTAGMAKVVADKEPVHLRKPMTEEIRKSVSDFIRNNGLNKVKIKTNQAADYAAVYFPGKNEIHVSNASIENSLLHELGHAKNSKTLFGKALGLGYPLVKRHVLIPTSAATYLVSKKVSDSKYAPALPIALATPGLLEEGSASLRATTHMLKRYGLRKGFNKSKSLLPAFASYAVAPAVTSLAIYADQKRRNIR